MGNAANQLWNPWANDSNTLDLYRRRCRQEAEEMTCAAQAAEILADRVAPGETLLDVGCGGGYYYWSFLKRTVPIVYKGLDYTPVMIDVAREEMCPRTDLNPEDFILGYAEDLEQEFDNIICLNVLTNSPHFGLPLGRLLSCARKRVLLRESMADDLIVRYTPDAYLDEGKRHIRVYHNTYPIEDIICLMNEYGFEVTRIVDRRTRNGMELVCDIPHWWHMLLAERTP